MMLRFLLANGIGQNVTASMLLGIPTLVWARVKLLPAWRAHHRRVTELHEMLVLKQPPARDTGDIIGLTTDGGDW